MTLKDELKNIYIDLDSKLNEVVTDSEFEVIIDVLITRATQRLIDNGFGPKGKAVKVIEGMRDE